MQTVISCLEETISAMCSDDYRERFKAEYWQLKLRIERLDNMLEDYRRGELIFEPECTITLLHEQLNAMRKYLDILEHRARIEKVDLGN